MNFNEKLDLCISEFLHVEEIYSNKMLDLQIKSSRLSFPTISLSDALEKDGFSDRIIDLIKEKYGHEGTTALRNSSPQRGVGSFGEDNVLNWEIDGEENLRSLHALVEQAGSELRLKGVNILFLSVGAISWQVADGEEKKQILTPLLIFPIRFIRAGSLQPVCIEFVPDEIRLNPSFVEKMKRTLGSSISSAFPTPPLDEDGCVILSELNIKEYYESINEFIKANISSDIEFSLVEDEVKIATFRSEDIAMYYDLLRNKDTLENSELVKRLFEKTEPQRNEQKTKPKMTLEADTAQEEIISRAVNGDNLVIKGPPGTGKTQTIANLISALMAEGKRVLFVSAKTSALAEVCKKLPQELLPYTLELFCESESEASKLSPKSIGESLKKAWQTTQGASYSFLESEAQDALSRRELARSGIKKYSQLYFTEPIYNSFPYYTLLERALAHKQTPRELINAFSSTQALTHERYLELYSVVEECEKYLNIITKKGTQSAESCVWLGASKEATVNSLSKDSEKLKENITPLIEKLEGLSTQLGLNSDDISLAVFENLTYEGLDAQTITALCQTRIDRSFFDAVFSAVKNALPTLEYDKNGKPYFNTDSYDSFELACKKDVYLGDNLGRLAHLEEKLSKSSCKFSVSDIFELKSTLDKIQKEDIDGLLFIADSYSLIAQKIKSNNEQIESLIPATYSQKSTRDGLFAEYSKSLAKYASKNLTKLPLLAFKAKRGEEEFKALAIKKAPSTNDITLACQIYQEKLALENELISLESKLKTSFKDADFGVEELCFLSQRASEVENKQSALLEVVLISDLVKEAISLLKKNGEPLCAYELESISELLSVLYGAVIRKKLENALSTLYTKAGIEKAPNVTSLGEARAVTSIFYLREIGMEITDAKAEVLSSLANNEQIREMTQVLRDFIHENELNPLYESTTEISTNDLRRLVCDLFDHEVRNSTRSLEEKMGEAREPILRAFLTCFITEAVSIPSEGEMPRLFEGAYFNACVRDLEAILENRGILYSRERLELLENQLLSAENDLSKANSKLIGNQLLVKDKESVKYAFLMNDKQNVRSARAYFKQYKDAILSLKKCFVLSPHSVSIFLKSKEYFDFDVLIVDEASQLPPRITLPCLMRAKQALFVGDQWQMPPIYHFVKKREEAYGDEDYESEESVLDLAIASGSIDTLGLKCHYRSQNESLIAYSQKRYYKDMTTFPGANPLKDGVGIVDILVKDGCVEKGSGATNPREADKVISLIREHFEKYYSRQTKTLSESLGVVVFGEGQLDLVKRKLENEKELFEMLNSALDNFDGIKEKLFFMTTVEKVQGQEVSHLIISLTYGRNSEGKVVNSFGMLNRDKLGERIFNVAVTRAIKSLTLVHSVEYKDITSPSLSYLREYLQISAKLSSKNEVPTFISSDKMENSLEKEVYDSILEMGIDKDRVICGYGVTESSLKVPLAILSEDKTYIQLGIFTQGMPGDITRYRDLNIYYVKTLKKRGWNIHKINIYDWYFNLEKERSTLKAIIEALDEKGTSI